MADFFISYNRADLDWAEWLTWQLESAGFSTIVASWDFRPGANFALEMAKATGKAERVIALLSPDYLSSPFSEAEWTSALLDSLGAGRRAIVPIRVRECKLEGVFSSVAYVDLVGKTEADAKLAVLRAIDGERRKPTAPPSYPKLRGMAPRLPSGLPTVRNLPEPRNPDFTGRARDLDQIRKALISSRHHPTVQAVVGLGGVGKTQLALEYCYRYGEHYRVIWWIRGADVPTLNGDLAQLGAVLKLEEAEEKPAPIRAGLTRAWLEHNSNWLLVLDDSLGPEESSVLPKGGTDTSS